MSVFISINRWRRKIPYKSSKAMEEEAGLGLVRRQSSQGFHMALSSNLQFGLRAEKVTVSLFGPKQMTYRISHNPNEDQKKIGKGQLGG